MIPLLMTLPTPMHSLDLLLTMPLVFALCSLIDFELHVVFCPECKRASVGEFDEHIFIHTLHN